jgi:hypothetical protein
MLDLLVSPVVLFGLSFAGLLLAAWVGARLRHGRPFNEERRADFSVLLASTLTLLGLLIGFTFTMAITRYDMRKNLEEGEANAIGTEYLRLDLLAGPDAARLRALLKSYVRLRVRYYRAADEDEARINAETTRLQMEMWSAVVAAAGQQRDPITALVVSGMNDVINSQSYTQAAWWNRIPRSAAVLLIVVAVLCNVMIGYGLRSVGPRGTLLPILPLFVAFAFALIADIDSPRHGLIRVAPQNLVNFQTSLNNQ